MFTICFLIPFLYLQSFITLMILAFGRSSLARTIPPPRLEVLTNENIVDAFDLTTSCGSIREETEEELKSVRGWDSPNSSEDSGILSVHYNGKGSECLQAILPCFGIRYSPTKKNQGSDTAGSGSGSGSVDIYARFNQLDHQVS